MNEIGCEVDQITIDNSGERKDNEQDIFNTENTLAKTTKHLVQDRE